MRVVKGAHFFGRGLFGVVHFEVRGEAVVIDEAVDHFHAFGFHGMFLAEFVLGDVFVVEVANFAHLQFVIIIVQLQAISSLYS